MDNVEKSKETEKLPKNSVKIWWIIIAIVIVAAITAGWWFWGKNIITPKYTGPVEKVRLSAYLGEFSGLIWVAENKGYFRDYGLDVTIKECQTGVLAMQDLLAGSADISSQAEFVTVAQSFNNNNFKIISSIASLNAMDMVARKDKGITQISNLKGKKIGVTQKSQAEYFLGTFLTANNLKLSDVQIVNFQPKDIVEAIKFGTIDAAMTWQPYVYQMENQLGTNAIIWPGQSDQPFSFVLASTNALIQEKPQVVERFLKAMVQAEKVDGNETEQIIGSRLKLDSAYMQTVWPSYNFQVTLDQGLLILMQNEAKWSIDNKLTDKTTSPNYLNYFYTDALKKIKPEVVTIIK